MHKLACLLQIGAALMLTAAAGLTTPALADNDSSLFPAHAPLGQSFGINPGRVVWVYHPQSVTWDGEGYWWELHHFDRAKINEMLTRGLTALTGKSEITSAIQALFVDFNARNGRDGGYQPGEKIAIKLNMNGSGAYDDNDDGLTHESYANAVLVRVLLENLVASGIRPQDITLYDGRRIIPKYMRTNLTLKAGFGKTSA